MDDGHRFCALEDHDSDTACRWPQAPAIVTWNQALALAQLPNDVVQRVFAQAHAQWGAVCGVLPKNVAVARMANIAATSGMIDGPSGILAQSELPCGVPANAQLSQLFDASEHWTESMLLAVACHEIGHAYGLPHLAKGNLMAPYYDPNITAPQAGDVAEMVARYGPPAPVVVVPAPTPIPAPDPGASDPMRVAITFRGKTYVGNLVERP